jgi:2-polyprenyl-3-methyl-5-hydroxy-6-metoxy-1,4-benzoquinol methylase
MKDEQLLNQFSNEIIRKCPLCFSDNEKEPASVYSRDSWTIKTCKKCSFNYLENVIPYSELIDNYAWTKTYESNKKLRLKKSPILKKISNAISWLRRDVLHRDKGATLIRQFLPSGRLLDVGCGSGDLLKNIPENVIPFGIEIESKTAKLCNEYVSTKDGYVWHNDAVSGLNEIKADSFDCITMQSYLEHEINPLDVLKGSFRVLKKGGIVIIKVPNFNCWNRDLRQNNWCGFRFPDHVNYFTPETLKKMILSSGFSVRRFNLADRSPLSDNMWMILEKTNIIKV